MLPEPSVLAQQIMTGDRVALARGITLVESTLPAHRLLADALLTACLPRSGGAFRLSVTGTPGVGKSTFIEAFGQYVIGRGARLAVLAIDPSSRLSRGSILGDKTRMQELSAMPEAFIRPSASGTTLGGVARNTRDALVLCEAAGFDVVIIETVGVGQSEVEAQAMTDFFLLLLQPGAGDELQGIKRGIVEMADMIVVNKADGNKKELALQAAKAYRNALHLLQMREDGWAAQVQTCSATEHEGLDVIWDQMTAYRAHMEGSGRWEAKRSTQAKYWLQRCAQDLLWDTFRNHISVKGRWEEMELAVQNGSLSAGDAAQQLWKVFVGEE